MVDDRESAEALIADLQKNIKDAFAVFDHEDNNTVDVSNEGQTKQDNFKQMQKVLETLIKSSSICGNSYRVNISNRRFFVGNLASWKLVVGLAIRSVNREIGTIIRSLGCCPSEEELHEIIAEVEEEEPTGFIQLDKFLPMMTKVLMERKYRSQPEDVILRAFQVLDKNNNGYLTPEELTKYLTQEGEPFTQEEMEEMLSAAVDPDKNVILYKDFAAMMTVEEY